MNSSVPTLSDIQGPLADLNEKLAGPNGSLWLTNLKRFLRKEIPWIANDPRNHIIKTLPPVVAYGKLCAFVLIDGINLSCGPLTATNLVEGAITRYFMPVPKDSTVQQLIIEEFTKNWKVHGFKKVTFLFEDSGGQTYENGRQLTHLPDGFFARVEGGTHKFETTDQFIFLVPISQPNPKDE